ncbi:MAG TPA: imidazolonepropionase [Candidatus Cloacimonas sp.]|nr:imidazolonepropionase [Candidatus Cloacimonas sp.]HQO17975.1 imidazolonepropionase [Candidatus Cloacimonas sp.]
MNADVIIINISQLVTLAHNNAPRRGKEMEESAIVTSAGIAIKGGNIIEINDTRAIEKKYSAPELIDAQGKIATPGFVDCHTHPVFVHTREDEFALRLQGKSYVEIALAGGGILNTIQTTRDADEDLLLELAKKRILKMISLGTTTLEAKSGYGLNTESELKQLRVIKRLQEELPLEIVPTFLGAHEFPAEYRNNHSGYVELLCKEMIPAVAEQGIAEFCDIFTEAHTFNLEESRQILSCAAEHGLKLKMHCDEIEPMGGAELAAEMKCISADHLGSTEERGIEALKTAGVIPVLLPATLFSLQSKKYANARLMMDLGLPVAIATDYNPGSCNCDSMQFTMSLTCLKMGLTPSAALCAATLNAAYALNRGNQIGSLEAGKKADLILWDIPGINFIPYHLGSSYVDRVLKCGKTIYRAT